MADRYKQPAPPRRSLKIFAFDPMLGRSPRTRIAVNVRNEPLRPGPCGERVEVVDYDGANNCYYEPIDLEDAHVAMQGGLDPSSSDPRFHQQMVYAVAMNVLENFDFALGRRIKFRKNRPLRILPHAFQGPNAFFHSGLHALLFGYFRADERDPGPNIPGQTIYTCLSQDIIAHETTHALVHRLRRHFMEPSNRDVAAFHEGFSDIVAILQHFSFSGILRDVIQEKRGELRSNSALVELAAQFGHASGGRAALRTAIDTPDPKMYQRITEPHARGSLLVGAVFDAFFTVYQRRILDLVRIATGGSGRLPDADLHPDLLSRIAAEAARTAQQVLTMCIRAFDYLPPVDITYGDYLRALVTADYELAPADEVGLRAAMIEAFRIRGIYARDVTSLAEESLLWEERPDLPPVPTDLLLHLVGAAQELQPTTDRRRPPDPSLDDSMDGYSPEGTLNALDDQDIDLEDKIVKQLTGYARRNMDALGLDKSKKVSIEGFHPSFRVAPDGSLRVELIAQFAQKDEASVGDLGGISFRGGATVVVAADGRVRHVISKPMNRARLDEQIAYLEACDATDSALAWSDDKAYARRMARRLDLATLHEGRY